MGRVSAGPPNVGTPLLAAALIVRDLLCPTPVAPNGSCSRAAEGHTNVETQSAAQLAGVPLSQAPEAADPCRQSVEH